MTRRIAVPCLVHNFRGWEGFAFFYQLFLDPHMHSFTDYVLKTSVLPRDRDDMYDMC